jgi:hypothetical protein
MESLSAAWPSCASHPFGFSQSSWSISSGGTTPSAAFVSPSKTPAFEISGSLAAPERFIHAHLASSMRFCATQGWLIKAHGRLARDLLHSNGSHRAADSHGLPLSDRNLRCAMSSGSHTCTIHS